jgi:hypothetical protein
MEQQINSIRRNRRTKEQIRDLLAEFRKTDITVKQFCQTHRISTGTFHKWKSGFKNKPFKKEGDSGFAPVVIGSSSPDLFAEIKGIRLYQPVSAAYLKELLA